MTTATLAGNRATSAHLQLPAFGVGWAEVGLDAEVTLSGAVELVLADLTVQCTVMSGGPSKGRSRYRVAMGAGGWGRTIAAKGYADDAGVKRAKVLTDAATACGETMTLDTEATPTRVGPSYVREEGPASRSLQTLAPGAWYVDEAGATRLGRRAAVELAVAATRGPLDAAMGSQTVAATSIATILPGVVVDGREAVDVLHSVTPDGGLRSTLWYSGITSTALRLELWRELAEALDPRRRFRGVTEYRVVTLSGERLNLQPVLVSGGMPDIQRVIARPGVAGCKAEVALGSRVGVAFMNADQGRPYVCCYEDAEGEGWTPDALTLDASDAVTIGENASAVNLAGGNVADATGLGRVVRYGDPILFGSPGQGTVSAGAVLNNFSKVSA